MKIQKLAKKTILLFFVFFSLQSFAAESRKLLAEKTLAFCNSVNELQQAYLKAVLSQEKDVKTVYSDLLNAKEDVVYPVDKLDLSSHYGDQYDIVKDLERSYEMSGEGLEIQPIVIEHISTCKREINRLQLFIKSFADYVNSNRYLNDIQQSERKIIVQKIEEEIFDLKQSLKETQVITSEAERKAEYVMLADHDYKNILIPMFEDLQFVSDLVVKSELDAEQVEDISLIKARRNRIAEEMVRSQKTVDYLMTGGNEKQLFRDFYLRYQTLLSNVQVMIESRNLSAEDKLTRVYQNRIVLEKLTDAYNEVRG